MDCNLTIEMTGISIPLDPVKVRSVDHPETSNSTQPRATTVVEVPLAEFPGSRRGRVWERPRPQRILAPVYPDETAETMERLRAIAGALSGELTTLSVKDPSRRKGSAGELPLRNVVLHGDPAARIRDYAALLQPYLILMPSRPARFGMKFWRRSVISDIVGRTDHDVMVVPVGPHPVASGDLRMVLCVVHLDGSDGPIIDRAAAVASVADSDLVLLHVLPPVNEGLLAAGLETFGVPLSVPLAAERMSRLKVPARSHRVEIRTGSVHKTIAAVARELGADLIVTGRSGWRGESPLVPGLQQYVSCPVMSVARGGQRSPCAQRLVAI